MILMLLKGFKLVALKAEVIGSRCKDYGLVLKADFRVMNRSTLLILITVSQGNDCRILG